MCQEPGTRTRYTLYKTSLSIEFGLSKFNGGPCLSFSQHSGLCSLILDSDSVWPGSLTLVSVASQTSLEASCLGYCSLLLLMMPKTRKINRSKWCLSVSLPGNGCVFQKRNLLNFDITFCFWKCGALQCDDCFLLLARFL